MEIYADELIDGDDDNNPKFMKLLIDVIYRIGQGRLHFSKVGKAGGI